MGRKTQLFRARMLADPFGPFLRRAGTVVLDGALATELERRGEDLDDPLWSARVLVDRPTLIRRVHDDYFEAGADVVITATYQATFDGLRQRGLDHAAAAGHMHRAVRIAIDSRDAYWAMHAGDGSAPRPLVAASVGPYGAFLADGSEYRGNYALDEAALTGWHRARFALLAASGADVLACETMPCAAESRAMLRLLDEHAGARAWISFTARDGSHISDGEHFSTVARECGAHPGVAAVGINCTAPEYVESLIRIARDVTACPVIVYPNSGETYDASTHGWVRPAVCPPFAEFVATWLEAGASIIGGCCRTTPDDIRAVRAHVDARAAASRAAAAPHGSA